VLPSRATRGKRLHALLEEDDQQADEEFWGQDFFREEGEDNEFQQQDEEEDVVDADFDNAENEVFEPLSDKEDGKEKKTQNHKAYKDPALKKAKKDKAAKKELKIRIITKPPVEQERATSPDPDEPRTPTTPITPKGDRVIRASTKTRTAEAEAVRERQQRILHKRKMERLKRKGPKQLVKFTQEELLEESKITAEYNIASLEYLLRIEDEKKKAPTARSLFHGPMIQYHSKGGINTITFTDVADVPEYINSKALPYPTPEICEITGNAAKYFDPKTGKPYSTKEAFKTLRERHAQAIEQALIEEKKKKKMELKARITLVEPT